jgi:hypothetical protein
MSTADPTGSTRRPGRSGPWVRGQTRSGGEGLGGAEEAGAGLQEAGVDGELVSCGPEPGPLLDELLAEADGPGALPDVGAVVGHDGIQGGTDPGGHGVEPAGEGLEVVGGGHGWNILKMYVNGQGRGRAGERDENAGGERR